MSNERKQIVLYGLEKHKEIINNIVEDLNIKDNCFDIKLLLTEALTNAFKHGNDEKEDKPIFLRYLHNGSNVEFEIEDTGSGLKHIKIKEEIMDEDILNESGRGLFLIKAIADKIEIKDNTLIIQKQLIID